MIHGYANVDDSLVWQVLEDKLPQLETALRTLLAGSPGVEAMNEHTIRQEPGS
ncbi:HepT-like ribonuclease domain-containing protein [Mycobacterium gordonae]|uniref:HepT-like ribonuclease domain-containing protein n=1 Tax=Mycobacterium gordonae TaxID=1778 RepID=UPI0035567A25